MKRGSSSSRLPKHKYESHLESELEEEGPSMPKHHDLHRRGRDSETDSASSIDRHERNSCRCEKEWTLVHPVNDRSQEGIDSRTYRLADKSSSYYDEIARIVAKWAKRPQVQMRSQIFDLFDPISFIGFLSAFRSACDMNVST